MDRETVEGTPTGEGPLGGRQVAVTIPSPSFMASSSFHNDDGVTRACRVDPGLRTCNVVLRSVYETMADALSASYLNEGGSWPARM